MDISKLDEYQGLEAQMVRDWMTRKGCSVLNGYWRHPTEKYTYPDGKYGGLLWANTLNLLSVDFGFGSVQALLREINPRMRGPGYPSDVAARAHGDGGWWVFQHQEGADDPRSVTIPGELHIAQMCLSPASNDVRFYWERGLMGEPCDEECLWWPCDANGNKVRWPTDAEGQML